MEHDDLANEMKAIEGLPVLERVSLAQKRRKYQMQNYQQWSCSEQKVEKRTDKKLKFTPEVELIEAVTRGNLNDLKSLLKEGTNPNCSSFEGLTALHHSCIEGQLDMARILLQMGANVNASDMDGWRPLHAAATCGHLSVVELLVRSGADLMAMNDDEDMAFQITEDLETKMFLEREMIYQGITEQMVNKCHRAMHSHLLKDINKAIMEGKNLDAPVTPEEASFLHVVIANFYNDLVKILLKNGASDQTTDREGWRPVHVAAYWGNVEAMKMLVSYNKTDLEVTTHAGETPYDLCDNSELKIFIIRILNKHNRNSNANSIDRGNLKENENHDFIWQIQNSKNMVTKENKEAIVTEENQQDISTGTRTTHIDIIDGIFIHKICNPLNKMETNVNVAERRHSFRDAKKYAPVKKAKKSESIYQLEEIENEISRVEILENLKMKDLENYKIKASGNEVKEFEKVKLSGNLVIQTQENGDIKTSENDKGKWSQNVKIKLLENAQNKGAKKFNIKISETEKEKWPQNIEIKSSKNDEKKWPQNEKVKISDNDEEKGSQNIKVKIAAENEEKGSQNDKVKFSENDEKDPQKDRVHISENEEKVSQNDKVKTSENGEEIGFQNDQINISENEAKWSQDKVKISKNDKEKWSQNKIKITKNDEDKESNNIKVKIAAYNATGMVKKKITKYVETEASKTMCVNTGGLQDNQNNQTHIGEQSDTTKLTHKNQGDISSNQIIKLSSSQSKINLPKNSLFYIKKQRLEQRKILHCKSEMYNQVENTNNNNNPYERPPSPIIRYSFIQPEMTMGPSIAKKSKKCFIM